MTQREKLIELILLCDKESDVLECFHERPRLRQAAEIIAEYLLNNGVVVLPCKISAKVYDIRRFYKRSRVVSQEIVCGEIDHFTIGDAGEVITTVCFQGNEWADYRPDELIMNLEEAKAALKKMEGEK